MRLLFLLLAWLPLAAVAQSVPRKPIPRPKIALPESPSAPVADARIDSLPEAVAEHYVRLAHARYRESLETAETLFEAIRAFISKPSPETHEAAKQAWIKAHRVYSTTEVFRFGNPNVDAWETRVNAWPIDEGFLDYVAPGRYAYEGGNPHALFNLISSDFQIATGYVVEARSEKDPKAGIYYGFTENETNVATGYHAIEFLLWGQDLNERPDSAGTRPFTDYLVGAEATGGNGARRCEYLLTIARILVADLRDAVLDWDPERSTLYAKSFRELELPVRLERMVLGMGGLSNGELAGERIQVALLASDQEEEQSCFSDTTHLSLLENALGVESLYLGRHDRRDGQSLEGPSLASLVHRLDPELDWQLRRRLEASRKVLERVVTRAEGGEPFDQMIREGNDEGRALLNEAISALQAQTELFETVRSRIPELAILGGASDPQ